MKKFFLYWLASSTSIFILSFLGVKYDLWLNDWIRTVLDQILSAGIFASQHWFTAMYLKNFQQWTFSMIALSVITGGLYAYAHTHMRDSYRKF
jgi:hypothetical protein